MSAQDGSVSRSTRKVAAGPVTSTLPLSSSLELRGIQVLCNGCSLAACSSEREQLCCLGLSPGDRLGEVHPDPAGTNHTSLRVGEDRCGRGAAALGRYHIPEYVLTKAKRAQECSTVLASLKIKCKLSRGQATQTGFSVSAETVCRM